MDSRKTGTRWGIQLISKLWNVIHQHWMHRNEVLHETEAIDQLSGIEILKEDITYEYNTGLDSLPYVYTPYFTEPLPVIMLKSTTYLKRWFLIIRSGREASCPYPRLDKFYTETCLRSWVGLKKKIVLIQIGMIIYSAGCEPSVIRINIPSDFAPCPFQQCDQAHQILLD